MPPLLLTFGNPLMDISVNINDSNLLEKYGLQEDDQKEIESEVIEAILKDVSSSLQELPGLPSGRCICFVRGAHRSLVANVGAASHFSLDFLKTSEELRNLIVEASVVYVEGFFLSDRFPVCQHLVEHVQNGMHKLLAYNLSACYVCEELTDESGYMAEHADIVFANAREFETLGRKRYGLETAEECAVRLHDFQRSRSLGDEPVCSGRVCDDYDVTRWLRSLGKLVVVTRDSEAVLLVWGGSERHTELVPVHKLDQEDIVDTTGAGDAFVGGFLYALLQGRGPRAAARFACRTAVAIIGKLGAEPPDSAPPELDDIPDEE